MPLLEDICMYIYIYLSQALQELIGFFSRKYTKNTQGEKLKRNLALETPALEKSTPQESERKSILAVFTNAPNHLLSSFSLCI